VAKKLTAAEMHRLARLGAAAKLAQLERDISALKRAFPGLKAQAGPVATPPSDGPRHDAPGASAPSHGRRTPMSPAERQTVSDRMKRYWDARRKAGNK
jgi:hypothetical protein